MIIIRRVFLFTLINNEIKTDCFNRNIVCKKHGGNLNVILYCNNFFSC